MNRMISVLGLFFIISITSETNGLRSDREFETKMDRSFGSPPFPTDGFVPNVDPLSLHPSSYSTSYVEFTYDGDKLGNRTLAVWMQTDICVGCKLVHNANLRRTTPLEERVARIDTAYATRIEVTEEGAVYPTTNNTYCELKYHFGLDGVYNLSIPLTINNVIEECKLEVKEEPIFEHTAIIVNVSIAFVLAVFVSSWHLCIKDRFMRKRVINHYDESSLPIVVDQSQVTSNGTSHKPSNTSKRLKSVDTFRGLAIMILTSGTSGDGQYWYMQHARYYGITFADLMFPWFVFAMGTAIHLSFDKLLSLGRSYRSIYKKMVIRSIILFLLGVCIQPHNDLRTLRIPGVLQRFGITYFIVASSYLLSRRLQARREERTDKCYMMFRDITDYLELPLGVICIAIQVLVTFLLPVPGCPLGYQGPGGPLVGENGELMNCTGGASGYIDRLFFTADHIIPKPRAAKVYHTVVSVDPEGILGSFTSVALCVFGLQAGKILHLFPTARGRFIRLIVWGLGMISCSAVLSKCHLADGWIPINKTLWSVSYIALTGGFSFIIVAVFHILVDVTHFWNGAPLIYAGMNSILLYIGVDLMASYLPFTWVPLVGNHTEYMIMGSVSMTIWFLIAYVLYRKKVFLKL